MKWCRSLAVIFFMLALSPLRADLPVLPKAKGEHCVAPTDVMQKQHMDFLLHQRDQTVFSGIRTKQFSLKQCIDCHVQTDTQGAFVPVNAPGQFCQACHAFASVKMDCFECHASKPDPTSDQAMNVPAGHQRITVQSFNHVE